MKIEILNDEDIDVFINRYYFLDSELKDSDSLLLTIRDIILKIDNRYHLNLSGFYKIKAYVNYKTGAFLNIVKIDDNDFSNDVDFRIIIYKNEKFLLESDEYDIFDKSIEKRFYNNKFYIDVEDVDDCSKYLDMAKVVYGDDARGVILRGKIIK